MNDHACPRPDSLAALGSGINSCVTQPSARLSCASHNNIGPRNFQRHDQYDDVAWSFQYHGCHGKHVGFPRMEDRLLRSMQILSQQAKMKEPLCPSQQPSDSLASHDNTSCLCATIVCFNAVEIAESHHTEACYRNLSFERNVQGLRG